MFRAALLSLACLYAHPTPALAQDSAGRTPAVPQVPESASEPEGLIGEPRTLERVVIFLDRHFGDVDRTGGLYADLWNMIPGAGWIAGGPGYRQWYATDRVFVDASAAISWRGYKTTQARFELPKLARSRLALGSQFRWQDFTHVDFFGQGADTLESSRSEYRLRSSNLVG